MADKKRGPAKRGGRVTPRGDGSPTAKGARRPAKADEPLPEVGRRPSNPFLLFAIAGLWVLAAVVIWSTFTAGWKLIPAVFAAGIGLLFLRGAVVTVARHEERANDDES